MTVDISFFGAVGDGIADCADALEAAVRADPVVRFPAGVWRFSRAPGPFLPTVFLQGSPSFNPTRHCAVLVADFDGDFLTWNGAVNPSPGTGGLCDLALRKSAGRQAGAALKLLTSSGQHPCWRWRLDNVAVSADDPFPNQGTWDYGLLADGTQVGGLRDLLLNQLSIARCSLASVLLTTVANFHWCGGSVYGAGVPNARVILQGTLAPNQRSHDAHLEDISIDGDLIIDTTRCFSFKGKATHLSIGGNASNGQLHVAGCCQATNWGESVALSYY